MNISKFIPLLIAGCATLKPSHDMGVPADKNAELKPQMVFSVDGTTYQGVATIQRKSSSNIQVQIPPKTILTIVSTCARQEEFWQPDTSKVFSYRFIPAMWVENVTACPMSIIAITSDGEWHRSIIDFTNAPRDPLLVNVECNGKWEKNSIGASICSIREGLPVRIQSDLPAVIAKDPNSKCEEPRVLGSKEWEISVNKGFCVYVMVNQNQEFRLITLGYSSFLKVYPTRD